MGSRRALHMQAAAWCCARRLKMHGAARVAAARCVCGQQQGPQHVGSGKEPHMWAVEGASACGQQEGSMHVDSSRNQRLWAAGESCTCR